MKKKIFGIIVAAIALISLASCGKKSKVSAQEAAKMFLEEYYSVSMADREIAAEIDDNATENHQVATAYFNARYIKSISHEFYNDFYNLGYALQFENYCNQKDYTIVATLVNVNIKEVEGNASLFNGEYVIDLVITNNQNQTATVTKSGIVGIYKLEKRHSIKVFKELDHSTDDLDKAVFA